MSLEDAAVTVIVFGLPGPGPLTLTTACRLREVAVNAQLLLSKVGPVSPCLECSDLVSKVT